MYLLAPNSRWLCRTLIVVISEKLVIHTWVPGSTAIIACPLIITFTAREYLRIIYGPDYSAPEHLERLRARELGTKRSLALPEFALGIESLQRFIERAPLRRVHECVRAG
jgi:PNKP adenylyltransferase domain, C-terminal region